MFKLGKIQNKVIEEPKRSNLLFQDNICPFVETIIKGTLIQTLKLKTIGFIKLSIEK